MKAPQDEQPTNGVAHSKEGEKEPSIYNKNYFVTFDASEIQKIIQKFRRDRMENEFLPSYNRVTKSFIDANGNWIIEWIK